MNNSQDVDPALASNGSLELIAIKRQTESARAELMRVRHRLEAVQANLSDSQAARLTEANEQLVLASLVAQKANEASEGAMQNALDAADLDTLTGLPNRAGLRARLQLAVAAAKQHKHRVALLLLALIDFRQVNDTVGQATGDSVLTHAASAIAAALPDQCTVSRHGSDEFLVLLPDVADAAAAASFAKSLLAALCKPARIDDNVFRLTAHVGISLYSDDGEEVDSLIDRAVAAMYRARWGGSESFSFVGEEAGSARSLQLRTLESLRQPVLRRDLELGEYALQQAMLQDANAKLVVAALGAQELLAGAERARAVISPISWVCLPMNCETPCQPCTTLPSCSARFRTANP